MRKIEPKESVKEEDDERLRLDDPKLQGSNKQQRKTKKNEIIFFFLHRRFDHTHFNEDPKIKTRKH